MPFDAFSSGLVCGTDTFSGWSVCQQQLEDQDTQRQQLRAVQNQAWQQQQQLQQYQQQLRQAQEQQWLQQTKPPPYRDLQTGQTHILKPLMPPLPPQ